MQQIVSMSWIGNEADIVEVWTRYHCALVDRMVVVCHRCEDNTEGILKCLQQEGLPVDVRTDHRFLHEQGEVLTALMRELALGEDAPDWILPLDGDEFLVSSGGDLHSCMAQLPRDHSTMLQWKTYVPMPSDDQGEPDVLRRITHRRASEGSLWSKILIPRPLACDPDGIIPLGSHRLMRKSTEEVFPSVQTNALHLAHFPVRSEEQLRTKIITGWWSLQADPKRRPLQAFQWDDLLKRCQNPRPISAQELHRIAMQYAVRKEDQQPVSTVRDPVQTPVRLLRQRPQLFDFRLRMPEPFPLQ